MDTTPNLEHLRRSPELAFPPSEWHTSRPAEPAAAIRQRLLLNERQIDMERARLTTESLPAHRRLAYAHPPRPYAVAPGTTHEHHHRSR